MKENLNVIKEFVTSYMRDQETHWIIKFISIPILAVYAIVLFFYLPIYNYLVKKALRKIHSIQEEKTPETTNPAKDDDKKEVTKKPGIVFDMGDDSLVGRKELIELSVKKIHDMVAEYISESGESEPVRVIFKINDSNLVADRYWLEVRLPPQGIEKRLWKRALFFGADKDSSDTFVSMLLESGTRQDILDNLNDPALIERLIKEVPNMSYHLEDL